jgi:hypothetical protein
MKKLINTCLSLALILLLAGCWVTNSEFNEYKAKAELTDKVLLCESVNDGYQGVAGSDEPNISRRDEPNISRRDEVCEEHRKEITGNNEGKCEPDYTACLIGPEYTNQECQACEASCLASDSGTWPISGVPSCPAPF